MRWIVLDKKHINVEMIRAFCWQEDEFGYGYLYVDNGGASSMVFSDPHRDLYRKLCDYAEQKPVGR